MWIALTEVPRDPVELVALGDPSIDTAALAEDAKAAKAEERESRVDRYLRTHKSELLPLKPGAPPPNVFRVVPLTDAQLDRATRDAYMLSGEGPDGQPKGYGIEVALVIFERGCTSIEANVYDKGEHKRMELERQFWPRLPVDLRIEIGRRIAALSQPPEAPSPEHDAGK